MSPDAVVAILVGLGVVVISLSLRARYSPTARARLRARRSRPTPIGEVRDGKPVLIIGRVTFTHTTLTAPLSGRRVCYYQARGNHDNAIDEVWEERRCDFLVDDGSGIAMISAETSASFTVNPIILTNVDEGTWRAWLERRQVPPDEHIRWRPAEAVLEDESIIAVYGAGEWEADPDAQAHFSGYRDTPRRLAMRASPRARLYVVERTARGRAAVAED